MTELAIPLITVLEVATEVKYVYMIKLQFKNLKKQLSWDQKNFFT